MKHGHSLQAIFLISLGTFFFAVMDASAKDLVSRYPVMQLLALRSSIVFVILGAVGLYLHGWAAFHTKRPIAHLLRMIACVASPYLFFLSLIDTPLTDATVIFFSSTFFLTALSWPVLGEKVGILRSMAVIMGFAGVVIVIEPAFQGFHTGAVLTLGASFFNAVALIMGRYMSETESTFKLVFSGNLGVLVSCLAVIPWIGGVVPFAAVDAPPLLILALFGLCAHLLLTRSFALAPVGTVAPFEYLQVIWAAMIGFAYFGEVPTGRTVLGAGIVILAGLVVIWRENRDRLADRERVQASPAAE